MTIKRSKNTYLSKYSNQLSTLDRLLDVIVQVDMAFRYEIEWVKVFLLNVLPIIVGAEIANIVVGIINRLNLSEQDEIEVIRWLTSCKIM